MWGCRGHQNNTTTRPIARRTGGGGSRRRDPPRRAGRAASLVMATAARTPGAARGARSAVAIEIFIRQQTLTRSTSRPDLVLKDGMVNSGIGTLPFPGGGGGTDGHQQHRQQQQGRI